MAMPQRRPSGEVETLSRRLLAQGFPRLQMLLLVSLAGLGGFLTSAALLYGGVESMAVRYAIATAAGYLLFLGLVRVWLGVARRRWSIDADLPIDLAPGGGGGGGSVPEAFSGAGGRFGGGGASGSFGPADAASASPDVPAGSGLLDAVPDVDEGLPIVVVLAVAVAAVGALVAVGMVIYASPLLFAEALIDAAVVGAVYRRARRRDRSYWLHGVLRRTWVPALALTVLFAVTGLVLQAVAPEAHSIGAVLGR